MVGNEADAVRAVVETHDAADEVLRFVKMNSVGKKKTRFGDFLTPATLGALIPNKASTGVHGRGNPNVAKAVASSRTLVERLGTLVDVLPDDRLRAVADGSTGWPDRLAASPEEFEVVAGEIQGLVDVLAPLRRNADLGRPLTG